MIKIENKRDYYSEIMALATRDGGLDTIVDEFMSYTEVLKFSTQFIELPSSEFGRGFRLRIYYNTITKTWAFEPISNVTVKLLDFVWSFENKSRMKTIGKKLLEFNNGAITEKELVASIKRMTKAAITKEVKARLQSVSEDTFSTIMEGNIVLDMVQKSSRSFLANTSGYTLGNSEVYQEEELIERAITELRNDVASNKIGDNQICRILEDITLLVQRTHNLENRSDALTIYPSIKEAYVDIVTSIEKVDANTVRRIFELFENSEEVNPVLTPEQASELMSKLSYEVERDSMKLKVQFPVTTGNEDVSKLTKFPSLYSETTLPDLMFDDTRALLNYFHIKSPKGNSSSNLSGFNEEELGMDIFNGKTIYVKDYNLLVEKIKEYSKISDKMSRWFGDNYDQRVRNLIVKLINKGVFKDINDWLEDATEESKKNVMKELNKGSRYYSMESVLYKTLK